MTVDYLQRATQAGRQIGFKGFDIESPMNLFTRPILTLFLKIKKNVEII